MKINCWEFKKCGREVGGKNAGQMGVCPAAIDRRLDGVHDGRNAGRTCWVVAGTVCGGQVQSSFGEKFKNCQQCSFYAQVRSEEGMRYVLAPVLMARMKNAAPETSR